MENVLLSEILRNNGLSVTEPRKKILALFLETKDALAHGRIEKDAVDLDRVTIYRTLQAFVEKGIIHTIPSDNNTVKYALCKEECGQGHHHHNHVHFQCTQCSRTICIDHVGVPPIKLPLKYVAENTEVLIKGKCDKCSNI